MLPFLLVLVAAAAANAAIVIKNGTVYGEGFQIIGYQKGNLREFIYVLVGTNTVDWNTALKVCESQGGQLISLETAAKETDLIGFLASKGHTSAWTSGNDIEENGKYVWATTGLPVGPHTNWRLGVAPNDPDCQCIGINAIKEHTCTDCIGVFRWDEESCSDKKKFICELLP